MERVPLAEAAQRLGLTVDATRKRIKRGLLVADKDADGRWYVTLHPERQLDRVDSLAMRPSTPIDRSDDDLRAEVAFLRERLREAEWEWAELRRMLNLEQQNIARLLPEQVSMPLLAGHASVSPARPGSGDASVRPPSTVAEDEQGEREGFWRRVVRVLFYA